MQRIMNRYEKYEKRLQNYAKNQFITKQERKIRQSLLELRDLPASQRDMRTYLQDY